MFKFLVFFDFKIITIFSLLSFSNTLLDEPLPKLINLFINNHCIIHQLYGEIGIKFWSPLFWSPRTGNLVDVISESNLGRYNHSHYTTLEIKSKFLHPVLKGEGRLGGNCAVKIVHLDFISHSLTNIHVLLQGFVLANEDPSFILFFENIDESKCHLLTFLAFFY